MPDIPVDPWKLDRVSVSPALSVATDLCFSMAAHRRTTFWHAPQIYGTQFNFTKDTPWTQDPYNRRLISDDLRRRLGVPSQAAQQKQLEKYKAANH